MDGEGQDEDEQNGVSPTDLHVLSLPYDIILELISNHLPIPAVLSFLCVCKTLAALNKPRFWYSYLHYHCKVLALRPAKDSVVWKELGLKVVRQTTAAYVPVLGPHVDVGNHTDFTYSNLWESSDSKNWIISTDNLPFWQINMSHVPAQFLEIFPPSARGGLLQCLRSTAGYNFSCSLLTDYEAIHPSIKSAENVKKIRTKSEVVEWKLTLDFCGPTVYVGNVAFDIAANQIFDMKLCGFPVIYATAYNTPDAPQPHDCCHFKKNLKFALSVMNTSLFICLKCGREHFHWIGGAGLWIYQLFKDDPLVIIKT